MGFKKQLALKTKAHEKYPKCVPAAKTARMRTKKICCKRKRSKAQGVEGKPTNTKLCSEGGLIKIKEFRVILAQRGFEKNI